MATLNEAPTQLQAWIAEIDHQMTVLSDQRAQLRVALDSFGPRPDPIVPVELPSDDTREAHRKADRERKKAERQRKTPAVKRRPGGSKYDYAEVARVAAAAGQAGLPMAAAVASKYNVSSAMGSFLIADARKRGHEIPTRVKPTQAAQSNVTPIAKPEVETANHPAAGPRAFTPADTLRIIEGGTAGD